MAKQLPVLKQKEINEACRSLRGKADTVGRMIEMQIVSRWLELFSQNFRAAVIVVQNLNPQGARINLTKLPSNADQVTIAVADHYSANINDYKSAYKGDDAKSFTAILKKVMDFLEGQTISGTAVPKKSLSSASHSKVMGSLETFLNGVFSATKKRIEAANGSYIDFSKDFFQQINKGDFRAFPGSVVYDIFLSCMGSSVLNLQSHDPANGDASWNNEGDFEKLKAFISAIKEESIVLNEWQIQEQTLKKYVIDRIKNGCATFPSRPGAVEADQGHDYYSRTLQNLTCIMPLFHWLYAQDGSKRFQNNKQGPPYGEGLGDKLAFDLRSRSRKIDQGKFYKADQFPLLFSNFDQSQFFVNKLFSSKDDKKLKSLLEISTDRLSKLVPKIELKKVFYKNDHSGRVEVPFEFANKSEILDKQNPRSNAGITNVTFEMLGQNPATVKKYIGCTMELYFDSINSFFKNREARVGGTPYKYQYKDLLIRKTKYDPMDPAQAIDKIKDLKKYSPDLEKIRSSEADKLKFEKQLDNLEFRVYNPEYFRIKLDLGWKKPIKPDKDTQNFIDLSNISLYLTLETHDFNFANDGSIQLSLKFMGTVESQLIEPLGTNIFYNEETDRLRLTANALSEIVAYLKSKTKKDDKLQNTLTYFLDLKADYISTLETKLADLHSNLWKSILNENNTMVDMKIKNSVPTHLLRGFANEELVGFGKTILRSAGAKGMLSSKQKDLFKGTKAKRVVLFTPQVMARIHQQINTNFEGLERKDVNDSNWSVAYELVRRDQSGKFEPSKMLKDFRFQPKAPPFEKQKKLKSASAINNHLGKTKPFGQPRGTRNGAPIHKGKIEFYFLRYGSIIQTAIHNIWNSNPQGLKDIVFVTGPIRFEALDGKEKVTNFSEIPILLENWKTFMINNVIKQKRQNYPVINYLHDTVSQLLEPALGTLQKGCGDGLDAMSPLKFVEPKIAVFTARRSDGFSPPMLQADKNLRTMHVSLDDSARFPNEVLKKEVSPKLREDVKHFIVLYDGSGLLKNTSDTSALYEQNLKQNVPHFFIGANKGIFRNVSFRKSDIPFYSESKVIDQGDTDGGLLREKYDVNLSLFGTGHFLQGMRFYLDPSYTAMSQENMRQLQRDIGLGGYYTITKVHSSITPQDFVTQVHGAWTSFEKGTTNK